MDDLISRQAAIEAIDAVFPVDPMKSEYAQGIACGAALAKTYVEQLPSAQKKGKWVSSTIDGKIVPMKDGSPVQSCWCSECGDWLGASDEYAVKGNFCPNCGADMRGAE